MSGAAASAVFRSMRPVRITRRTVAAGRTNEARHGYCRARCGIPQMFVAGVPKVTNPIREAPKLEFNIACFAPKLVDPAQQLPA
jgi:hypothetical protein